MDKNSTNEQIKKKTTILTIVLSLFIIGGLGTWGYYKLYGAKSASDFDLPSNEEVAAAGTSIYKPAPNVPVTEIQRRINVIHEFWNRKLGFGAWNKYSITSNKKELIDVKGDIQDKLLPYVSGPLKADIETAIVKIDASMKSDRVEPLKHVHRIFHDLDITLNGYEQDGVYWEVTETWKWLQKAH